MIKKTVIFTDYNCNNQCVFCIDAAKRGMAPRNTREIKMEMMASRQRGTTYIEFIGGEVTIRQDCLTLISTARKLGFTTIAMATNGRMLSYLEFARKLIDSGLTNIILSIHGHTRELHDQLTRSGGSFDQLMAGLSNLRRLGFDKIGSNTTIVNQNYRQLPEIGRFLLDNKINNSEFIFVDPNYGGAKADFLGLVPKISQAAPYIRDCLDLGRVAGSGHWHARYVPLCYFPDHLDQISELDEVKKFNTEHIAPDFINLNVEASRAQAGRTKAEVCGKCRLNDRCEGIWKEYAARYGLDELEPLL